MLNSSSKNNDNADVSSDSEKFIKFNKINKLRDLLKSDNAIQKHQFAGNNYDLIDYFKDICSKNKIQLNYVQYLLPDNEGYYGEIFLESFRLICETNKKRKKCQYYAYKSALEILCSSSELAVKVAPKQKRDVNIRLDNETNVANEFNNGSSCEIGFEYELYRVDSNQGIVRSSSNRHITNTVSDIENVTMSLPPVLDNPFKPNQHQNDQNLSLNDLNQMLKSMILPKQQLFKPLEDTSTICVNESIDVAKKKEIEENENDEDEDDDSKLQAMDKKTKIKQNLENFCLFIQATSNPNSTDPSGNLNELEVHERNSLQILNNSCLKSNCNLEFELKLKTGGNNKGTKTIISGDHIQSESDDENNTSDESNQSKKYKCKCLINGVKIASSHATNKIEAKRLSALKSIKYLIKIFPAIKETNYQNSINTNQISALTTSTPSTTVLNTPTAKYFKISKEDLFKGLIPPTLFESSMMATSSNHQGPNFQIGNKLLTKMGWKGEGYGLGKFQQGITKPIELDFNRCRLGFGFARFGDGYDDELLELDKAETTISSSEMSNNDKSNNHQANSFKKGSFQKQNNYRIENINQRQNFSNKPKKNGFISNIVHLLSNFISSSTENDLIFSNNLSIEDRKFVHREAHRLGLKTRSEGKGEERFLVVQKKRSSNEIVESALKNGGQISKYKIISKGDF